NRDGEIIWALKDVSFTVEQGEVLGVIGRNGAGKSTLLKILSRITAPTEGVVRVKGRIASLLEVGTGFHPELTGRENIYLNGAILGMSRKEIDRKFDEIVAFAEIEPFIDTPVKRYSSGMYVRLAFAVAAHLDAEILLVDEVLAVGDAAFQKKCLGKMGDVASQEGRTVLFVSHNMAAVSALTRSSVVFDRGMIYSKGDTDTAILDYVGLTSLNHTLKSLANLSEDGNNAIEFVEWWIEDKVLGKGRQVRTCSPCLFVVKYRSSLDVPVKKVTVSLTVKDRYERAIFTADSHFMGSVFEQIPREGYFTCQISELPLAPGDYVLHLFCSVNGEIASRVPNAGTFGVVSDNVFGNSSALRSKHGVVVLRNFAWNVTEEMKK
uniref:ABC transporter ATP-binding protein n=1 Tax=Anaerolinea sp. TaxID=1872519 RepID=UPI002ACE992C